MRTDKCRCTLEHSGVTADMGKRRGIREVQCFCKAGKIVAAQAAGISEVISISLWFSFPGYNLEEIFPSDSDNDCISVMLCWGTTGALQRDSILSDSCFKDGTRNAKIWLGFAPKQDVSFREECMTMVKFWRTASGGAWFQCNIFALHNSRNIGCLSM